VASDNIPGDERHEVHVWFIEKRLRRMRSLRIHGLRRLRLRWSTTPSFNLLPCVGRKR